MPAAKTDLKFYLTSSEPYISQVNAALSVGGYASTTEISLSSLLAADTTTNYLYTQSSLSLPTKVMIGDEIRQIVGYGPGGANIVGFSGYSGGTFGAFSGFSYSANPGFLKTNTKFHLAGDSIFDASNKTFFNNSINANGSQYRCVAVKNTGLSAFYNLSFFVKNQSINNNTTIQLAIEVPQFDIKSGTATLGTTISLVDSHLFVDETDIIGSVLKITSGSNINQTRVIASFDEMTGTITFLTAMPTAIMPGTTYIIENTPAQRLTSGLNAPLTNTAFVSSFGTAVDVAHGLSINRGGRVHAGHLFPNEIVYLWFQRTVSANVDAFVDNRIVFSANYTLS